MEISPQQQPPSSLPPIRDVTAFLTNPPVTSSLLSLPGGNSGGAFLQSSPDLCRSASSDTSGVASNYSSPGIDLSALSFGAQSSGQSASNCFTFASGGSGGQFTLNSTEQMSRATCETPPSRIEAASLNMDTTAPPSTSVLAPARTSAVTDTCPTQSQMGSM